MLEKAFQVVQDVNDFRYSAPTTQGRRDRYLQGLFGSYRPCKTIRKDIPDNAVKQILYSRDA
jgi:hypothetical protein